MMAGWFKKHFSKNKKALVLMYHRVADCAIDPWQLCVSKEMFEQQLSLLQNSYNVVSTGELVKQLKNVRVSEKTICITFDDGYMDNYFVAKPLLEKYGLPATFFITTDYAIHAKAFWWDELQNLILERSVLPGIFKITVNNFYFEFDLGDEKLLTPDLINKHLQWKDPMPPPTLRSTLYYQLWQQLKPMPYNQIEAIMNEVKEKCGGDLKEKKCRENMSQTEIASLFKNNLFSAGLHTATHPALAFHSANVQQEEILRCKNDLEYIMEKDIEIVAYPYGNYNKETIKVVNDLKLSAGFSTEEQSITYGANQYALGRIMIGNWSAEVLDKKLEYFFKNV